MNTITTTISTNNNNHIYNESAFNDVSQNLNEPCGGSLQEAKSSPITPLQTFNGH